MNRLRHAHRPDRDNPLADAFVIGLWILVIVALTAVAPA